MVEKYNFIQNFLAKNEILIKKHIFTILKLLNFIIKTFKNMEIWKKLILFAS
jgi:hypothetical protein